MVVVNDRSMANVHVVGKRYPYSIISFYMHSFHRAWFCKQIITRNSDFDWRKLKGVRI